MLACISFSPFGHNGSGKSNILLGFSFVLGEIGNSAAERRLLLHVKIFFSGFLSFSEKSETPPQNAVYYCTSAAREGLQGRVTSGFVELTLDNASRRLCMFDADSVVIRRSFSFDTDEIFVQGNAVSLNKSSNAQAYQADALVLAAAAAAAAAGAAAAAAAAAAAGARLSFIKGEYKKLLCSLLQGVCLFCLLVAAAM
ncbi:structural maintenance of chromosome domain-containing protein, putative [Eimeria praecox]|uniref:Structural maintenance of chromosome domain-containing protein, putative n=1 Tax=Eimeria praecox TaxID=51316 RepID=U6G653_9EIME|nr:structural maintenance of chromosome domain-containing protein, putative [Eimeria praecox]